MIPDKSEPFPGDSYSGGQNPMPTVVFIGTSEKELDSDQILDIFREAADNPDNSELFISYEHALITTDSKAKVVRKITISVGRGSAATTAAIHKINWNERAKNPEPARVKGGSLIFGDYQWGHPEADEGGDEDSENGSDNGESLDQK